MHYIIEARIVNRPSGAYRYSHGVPTFLLRDDIQMITSASNAAEIARSMIENMVRQDISSGAYVTGTAVAEDGSDYSSIG